MATSVNSSTSTASPLSAKTGMAGLVSGLDTDSLVEKLTSSSRSKVDKQQQNVQKLEWKQTAYRNVSKGLKEFQSKYLDVLSTTNFRSASLYNTVKASTASTKISVQSTSAATAGSIEISKVTQLATSQTISGVAGVSDPLTGGTADITGLLNEISATSSKSFLLKLDGKVRTITLDQAFKESLATDTFETALQKKVSAAFGEKSAGVPVVDAKLGGDGKITFSASGSQLTINALNADIPTLTKLGFTNGQSDKITASKTLADISTSLATPLSAGGEFKFSINGEDFSFKSTETLSIIMSKVNASDAGVTMAYSSITDKFTLTAKESGTGNNIDVKESAGNLMEAFGLSGAGSNKLDGQNAMLEVNGQAIVRTSNSIEVNGVKIQLLEITATDEKLKISMSEDTTSLKDTIKSFVADYNNMISMMNGLIKEKKGKDDSDYQPLTDAQKKEMTEKQIEAWETKAKVGLLKGDSVLKGITSNMQAMMYGSAVSGGISLYDLGISSAGYAENGKLKIDDEKLDTALKTKSAEIKELFTAEKTGLANQLNSVIDAAVKTSGVKGTRGSLIELAGYESTLSNTENSITEKITKSNKNITNLKKALKTEESYYWNKFTALETALQQLNSQSAMISSFGSSS